MTPSAYDWTLSSSTFPPIVGSEVMSENNNGSEATEDDTDSEGCRLYSFITSTLIIGVLCGLGLVGNTVSFFVFVRDSIKTSTLFLFQGLCVIDNLLLLTVFPLYCIEPFVRYTGLCTSYLNQGHSIVLIYIFPLASVSQTATIWVTVLVGINRYIAVCKPYQAVRLCTVRQARIQLAVVLLFALLYNVTRFAEGYLDYQSTPNGTLIEAYPTELGESRLYIFIYDNILYMVFMLILPLLVLTVLNIRLVKALKRLSRKRAEMQSATQRQDNNVTLVLIIVIIVFIVCQTPALANRFMWTVLDDGARDCGGVQFYFRSLSNLLVIANSAVNFVIYFIFNTRFRQILVQGLGCCCCCAAASAHQGQPYAAVRSSHTTTSNSANHHNQLNNPSKETDANPTTAAF